MTADAPAIVGWAGEAPTEEARRLLGEWARAHGVVIAEAAEEKARAVVVDWAAGDRIEEELAQAREALTGLDLDAAERHLARAGGLLREHPELPHAAWLRAEVERGWSARWLRDHDEDRARRAWQRAAALDGGRAPGLGEKAFDAGASVVATVTLVGNGVVRIDGAPVAPGEVTRGAGEHAVVITRADGAVTWAAWVALEQGANVRLAAPEAPPCSREDVSRAAQDRGAVRCPRWVSAMAAERAVRVAMCAQAVCDPYVEWRAPDAVTGGVPAGPTRGARGEGSRWPGWATWAIAGAAVVGTAVTAALVSSAARAAPSETRFVNGGVQLH